MAVVASTMGRVLERPATATLGNGDEVTINDYVYFAPPWSERDGSPYSIARIIEFLPPTAAKYNHNVNKGPSKERHVRIALFYRPSEISGRLATDHRLLLAAIHSEVHPVSWLRGKCWVRHREKIENLQEWKKKPDHFHYSRLFDPYIKREYEMIRTTTVTNVPDYVRRVLAKRYEFLVVEKEMVADLTDAFRTCRTCLEWAASQESVKCEICKAWYHMDCVSPPLPAKPTRGYSWMCSQCMHDRVSRTGGKPEDRVATIPMTQIALARASRGKAKEKSVPIDYDKPDAFFRGWNFRYFGQYTVAEHSVDSDDPIFPRQVTRLGQRYQAVVPTWEEQQVLEKARATNTTSDEDLPERGTAEEGCFSTPQSDPEVAITKMRTMRLAVPGYSVEAYDHTLSRNAISGPTNLEKYLSSRTAEDFGGKRYVRDLNTQELEIFETELMRWGSLEAHETAKKLNREPWEVVRFYYKWRNEKLASENATIRDEIAHAKTERQRQRLQLSYSLHEPPDVPVKAKKEAKAKGKKAPRYLPKNHKAVTGVQSGAASVLGHQREATPETDAEGSVWEEEELTNAKPACAACGVKKDTKWWKAARSQQGSYLCNHCGSSYRKYGVSLPYRAHLERLTGEKRASTPIDEPSSKRQKIAATAGGSKAGTPPPPLPAPAKLAPCAYCYKMEPKPMARCRNCTFAVHPGCYGVPKEEITDMWLCDPCANEKTLEASLDITCVLCPKSLPNLRRPLAYRPRVMPEFDFLQAVKPTEGYKWTHVLCATFTPDLQWSDGGHLQLTEGIMSLKPNQFGDCDICGQSRAGVTIRCGDCPRRFHPACAWMSGYRFAFEMHSTTGGKYRREKAEASTITFKGVTGVLTPQCLCTDHSISKDKRYFDITDIDPVSGLSALQAYASSAGQVPREQSFGLLRKAKRLEDQVAKCRFYGETKVDTSSDPCCIECGTDASPKWYPQNDGAIPITPTTAQSSTSKKSSAPIGPQICHQCSFRKRAGAIKTE